MSGGSGWDRVPLRTALPVLLAVLLAAGLLVSGVVAHHMLQRTLVDQLDTELDRSLPRLVDRYRFGGLPEPGSVAQDGTLPSDYVLVLLYPDGEVVETLAGDAGVGLPALPPLDTTRVAALERGAVTVGDVTDAGRWRLTARTLADPTGRTIGSVAVALPMDSVDDTLARMRRVLGVVGIAALAVVVLAGWWAVRRATAPLAEMERTAAAIADGDLTQRVPDAPPGTEVGRLARALNAMLTQLERAFAARAASEERMRRFVADASHELRTPLAAVRGYAELHRMGALPDDDAVTATFRRVEESATRMGRLVEDLLQLARLDEGRPRRDEPVELAVLAADALADLRALDPARPVRLEPLVPGRPLTGVVRGDPDQLRQVLANLVGNVVRHTPSGTPVELRLGSPGTAADVVVLEVRDHGPGIPPEHAARVFERFYRVDPSRTRDSGGSGLGMAIVAGVVAGHHGDVAVTPTEGGGTTVRVTLPALPAEPGVPAEPGLPAEPGVPAGPTPSAPPGTAPPEDPAG